MHPIDHAKTSAKIFGGDPESYLPLHMWLDETKETFCDFRHRALRHHSQGIFEAERVFGVTITNSLGRQIPTRYLAEQHVKEDCGGRIPTVQDWFKNIKPEPWMHKGYRLVPEQE